MKHPRALAVAASAALLAIAWVLPHVRHRMIGNVVTYDAPPGDAEPLPPGQGPGMMPAPRVRVILIDGLSADTARTLPVWSRLCGKGLDLTVDVGFPTVSLPVEVALWSGLTQQQTGVVFRSDRPLVPPLDARAIPAQVPGSEAIAQDHGYIVRSLGFSRVEPAADPADPTKDADPAAWKTEWQAHAAAAVAGPSRLVFVHVLQVDTAGHAHGHDSPEYHAAATGADALVAALVAGAPDARWFLLSDHGHLDGPHGGHGGEEREIRHVRGCIVGPGVRPGRGELVHVVDVSRAIADSVGAVLPPQTQARPLSVALAAPLEPDQAVPSLPPLRVALALAVLVLGAVLASTCVRQWWLAPWWFVLACGALLVVRGAPTLSRPWIYAPSGLAMTEVWLPALAVCLATTYAGLGVTTLPRVLAAQLGVPLAAVAAAFTACGAWPAVLGAHVAPVVPRVTAWMSPLLLVAAHGSAAAALGVLGRLARSASGRRAPPETPRSAPGAGS